MRQVLFFLLFPVFVFSQTFGRNDTTFTIKKIGSWNDKNEINLIVDGCIEHGVVITILPMDFKILQNGSESPLISFAVGGMKATQYKR